MTALSSEIFNAREQILSSDLNRLQRLSSREFQDVLKALSRGPAAIFSGFAPISGFIDVPTLTPIAASFTYTLSAGSAMFESSLGITPDDSSYQAMRWPSQVVGIGTPDGVNPRIDLICAAPGSQSTDLVTRDIMVDPTLRTVVATSVDKTQNPRSTISVVPGVAATPPARPAVPAGLVALFEVYVPAGVADSSFFSPVPALWRLAPGPWGHLNGVLRGMHFRWEMNNTGHRPPQIQSGACAVVIDGEVIEFTALPTSPSLSSDTKTPGAGGTDPFDAANPAGPNGDAPFYIYAVGGRWSPQLTGDLLDFSGDTGTPIALVASTTPPNAAGYPTVTIKSPRGDLIQKGAVYVGLGYTDSGTSNSKPCTMDDVWLYSARSSPSGGGAGGFESNQNTFSGGPIDVTLASAPNLPALEPTAKVLVHVDPDPGLVSTRTIFVGPKLSGGGIGAALQIEAATLAGPTPLKANIYGDVALTSGGGAQLVAVDLDPLAADVIDIGVMAYPHGVTRI